MRKGFIEIYLPEESFVLVRLEDKSVCRVNYLLFSCPKGKDPKWSKQGDDKCWDGNRKCPSKMFRLPALNINIVNEVIFGVFYGAIILATKERVKERI